MTAVQVAYWITNCGVVNDAVTYARTLTPPRLKILDVLGKVKGKLRTIQFPFTCLSSLQDCRSRWLITNFEACYLMLCLRTHTNTLGVRKKKKRWKAKNFWFFLSIHGLYTQTCTGLGWLGALRLLFVCVCVCCASRRKKLFLYIYCPLTLPRWKAANDVDNIVITCYNNKLFT